MQKPVSKLRKVLDFLAVVRYLQKKECAAVGMEYPGDGYSYTLPDGSKNIKDILWGIACEDQWGNQQFNNDSFYRFTAASAESLDNREAYTARSPEQYKALETLREEFKDHMSSDDDYDDYFLFYVSW